MDGLFIHNTCILRLLFGGLLSFYYFLAFRFGKNRDDGRSRYAAKSVTLLFYFLETLEGSGFDI